MVKPIYISENEPYPNNPYPVLYYKGILNEELGNSYTAKDVIQFFENNGYTNSWVGGMMDKHHFHSTAHEVLACTKGKVQVQLGGPNEDMYTIRKGDVVLLPAGVSHKKLKASADLEIVGAYPSNNSEYDYQYGDAGDYDAIKQNIAEVEKPLTDPVTGSPKNIDEYWTN